MILAWIKALPKLKLPMVLLAGFGFAWVAQDWRYSDMIAQRDVQHSEATQEAIKAARAEERKHFKELQDAERKATKRAQEQAAAARAANAESDSLRRELADYAARVSEYTEATLRERTLALSELLGECSDHYQGMADQAQKHANDVRLLWEGWPRESQ